MKKRDFQTIEAWEEQLARAGAYIVSARRATVELLSPMVQNGYYSLFPGQSQGSFTTKYTSQPPLEESSIESWYVRQYALKREYEARVSTTLTGPHRDDLEWMLHERPFRTSASLGQARAVALSLRIAEWKLLFERSHEEPLFLVDDCEGSLDQARKASLLSTCSAFEQVFTSAHEPQSASSHKIRLVQGRGVE